MTRNKSIIGALVLCALAFCAFGAQGASALELTAATCVKGTGTTEYTESHCETVGTGGGFVTKAIAVNTSTELEGDAIGKSELIAAVGGVNVNVTCEHAHTVGNVKNEAGPPMVAKGSNVLVHYTECHAVLVSNPARTCTVRQGTGEVGTLTTNELNTVSSVSGAKHLVTLTPAVAGGSFIVFQTSATGGKECPAALNGVTVTVAGSAVGESPAAKPTHLTFSGVQSGLTVNGGANPTYNGTNNSYMKGEVGNTVSLETF